MTYEGLRLKINQINRDLFKKIRFSRLSNKSFSIISNNCWGGMIYESYGLRKNSPTVGLFFMAEDYIKFLQDLEYYLQCPIHFIDCKESKWRNNSNICGDKRFGSYPIGRLKKEDEEIEIFFLHYHSEEEVMNKWKRRCERIDFDNLVVKFNDQNGCTDKELNEFLKLPFKNKVFFTVKDWNKKHKEVIVLKQYLYKEFVLASHEPFGESRKFNVTKFLNGINR